MGIFFDGFTTFSFLIGDDQRSSSFMCRLGHDRKIMDFRNGGFSVVTVDDQAD